MLCVSRRLREPVSDVQVLAEVLQQQARLDDPTAAARQEFERCEDSINAQRSLCTACGCHQLTLHA